MSAPVSAAWATRWSESRVAALGHDMGVQPHAAPAAAAAQGVVAIAGHLHEFHARHEFQQRPRRIVSTRTAGPGSSCRGR